MPPSAPSSAADPRRLIALDSLRFVAAAVVLAAHSQALMPWRGRWPWWAEGLLDARSAVVFFFVLSGFVLHLSWKAAFPDPRPFAGFVVRRMFRIYPLYYLSLALAMAVVSLLPLGECPLMASEPAAAGLLAQDHGNLRQWAAHLLLLDPGLDWTFLNPPIWTLNAEMQAAFVFPLLSWLIGRDAGWRSFFAAGLLLVAAPLLGRHLIPNAGLLPLFALGAVLAAAWEKLAGRLSAAGGVMLLLAGLWLYAMPVLPGKLSYYRDVVAGIGSAAVMLAVLRLDALRSILEWRPLAVCGGASYGLYVLQYPLLLALCWLAWKCELPPLFLLAAGLGASLLLAIVARTWIEKPMIAMGKKAAKRIEMSGSQSAITQRSVIVFCGAALLLAGLGLHGWLRPTSQSLIFWLCWAAAAGGLALFALALVLRPGRALAVLCLLCVSLFMMCGLLTVGEIACRLAGFDFSRAQRGSADPRSAWPLCFREPDEPFGEVFFKRAGSLSWTGRPLSTIMPIYHATDEAYQDEKEFTLALDPDGFRNPVPFPDWDAVVVGDSFTEAGYLPFEEVFTSVAAKASGMRVKNLGVCHTGPLSHIEFLKAFGSSPSCRHAVLVFFEGNDIRDAERERDDLRKFRETGKRPIREAPAQTSLLKAIYQAAKSLVRFDQQRRFANAVFTAGGKHTPVTLKSPPMPEDPRTMSAEQRQLVSSFLNGWKSAAASLGMKPWLLYIPANNRAYYGLVRHDEDSSSEMKDWQPTALPEWVRKECEERGIAFIDGCGPLRAAAENGTLVCNPIFDTHLNAEGSRLIGEALAAALAPSRP